MTRPDETFLDGRTHGPVSITLTRVRSRRRLHLSTQQREKIGWLEANNETAALAELSRLGQIILHPLIGRAQSILDRRRELLESDLSDKDVIQELLAIENRYQRLSIEKGGRLKIYDRMEDHLQASIEVGTKVYVVVLPDTVELWSQQFRQKYHGELWEKYGGLEDQTE